ncbi:MAG: cation-translocating P-type ATPase [Phycisphaerales bacterium]|nr:cation-translocating P-type ATPase [Phycisphaerales bacterium]
MASSTASSGHSHDHTHQHVHEEGMVCCSHHNVKLERYMLLYLIGGVLLLATVISKWLLKDIVPSMIADIPAIIGALLLGFPLFVASAKELWKGHASTSTLCAIAILGSLAINKYEVAGFLAFILLVADQFVRQRAWGAQRAIEDLVARTPDVARVVRDGAETEIGLSQVKIGDVLRVRTGENLPVDGVVVVGRSTLDQAALTGEAIPHEVAPGDAVFAGTTNLSALIEIKATQVGGDTTIGKVTQLIREAESSKTQRQLMVEQVARFFVPVTLSVSFIVWFLNRDHPEAFQRALTTLVVACPSALLLASPLSVVAAFAAAARLGILVKKVNYLEEAASVDTVVMDKTGTITTGRFAVSRLVPAAGVEGAELLAAAANGEQHSNHPLARSIIATAKQARIEPDGTNQFEEVHGRGIRARTSMGEVCVGRSSWLTEVFPNIAEQVDACTDRIEGMSGVHVVRDGRYLGVVALEDRVRSNSKAVISRLRELGIRRIDILTGDRLSVAERVGRNVGVDTIEAECLPEEKHEQIQALVADGRRVMMVGDGINDGPSLAAADIGVAMGLSGSDIAANSAGVALMNDDLSRIPFLIELSRRTRTIVAQNIAVSILVAIVGLTLAATGSLGLIGAALYHVVGDVFVIANSFRLFRFGEAFQQSELAEVHHADAPVRRRRQGSLTLNAAGGVGGASVPQPV